MTSHQDITCQQCGGPLPRDGRLMGLCPRCLLERIVDVRREVQAQMERVRPWPDAPDPTVLSAALPSLEVQELIGRGGMGLVYKARQKNLDREVALKILPAERASDPAVVARFTDEARILGALNHPNIIMALDAGRVQDWFYIVMELVQGPNLREVLRRDGKLPQSDVITLATQLSAALAYAHARNVIHRDIKPENILLESGDAPPAASLGVFFANGGKVRVADFGIARLLERTEFTITAPHQVVGTLDYLAPEGRQGSGEAGPAADVYAVGVMLYEMLTGKIPAGHFPPPSRLADVDRSLDAVVMKALRSDPRERYPDGAALHRALVRAAKPGRFWKPALAIAALLLFALAALTIFSRAEPDRTQSHTPATQPKTLATQHNTLASTQPVADIRVLMPGDTVQALWGDQWLSATVIEREGRRVKIHYEGWSDTLDEWVTADRLKW